MDYKETHKLMVGWTREAGYRILDVLNSTDLGVSIKAANPADIVTKADIASEDYLRQRIVEAFPDHNILGEERTERRGKSPYTWVIDPVDGTTIMSQGMDYFGVSLGLWKNAEPQVGIVSFPSLGIVLETERRAGTFINGNRVELSISSAEIDAPTIAFDFSSRKDRQQEAHEYLIPLLPHIRYPLSYCCIVYSALLLLQNKVHAVIHPGATPYDLGAVLLAVSEAGGDYIVIDTDTKKIDLHRPRTSVIMATNEQMVRKLRDIIVTKGA